MSETAFPINDLLRRKLQTSLVITSLTLCVASTLFLLLFSERVGFGILTTAEGRLSVGFSIVFSQFVTFIGILIFVIGIVIISFMVFVMMSQRIRDIGLMKAAGCPNDLIFGYFMMELLLVTFFGCLLGTIFGILADYASGSLLASYGFQFSPKMFNFWLVLIVFALFFTLSIVFGAKPILDTTKVEPAKAISPFYYFGLSKEPGFKVLSKSGLASKLAMRSLFRRKSATIRIVVCLTAVFILVTVAVAGGIIAEQTTMNWIEKAVGRDLILIAHQNVTKQYELLLSKFYEVKGDSYFNYTDERYFIPEKIPNELRLMPEISGFDARLIMKMQVAEVQGYIIDPETAKITSVGDSRKSESLVIGVDPDEVLSEWFLDGKFLEANDTQEAVLGDSLAHTIFSMPLNQSIRLHNSTFDIVGVCMDPVNNGNLTYVPIKALQNLTGTSKPNIVIAKIDPLTNRTQVLTEIETKIASINPEFEILELNDALNKNLEFLSHLWSTIMFLPLFSLASASLCLISYVMLAIAEQRQEFGILRAIGAEPKTVVKIVANQSLIVLLSSYGMGIALGIIITLLILVPKPFVTAYTIIEISAWLLIALTATFALSLYPATRFARKPLRDIMS